jgi:adenylylsulfate kinase-like enzyme
MRLTQDLQGRARSVRLVYSKARAGLIETFTSISDPYEPPPSDSDIVIDTGILSAEESADVINLQLKREGYIRCGAA